VSTLCHASCWLVQHLIDSGVVETPQNDNLRDFTNLINLKTILQKPNITIDDFAKLDIRVGLVVEAKPVPNSKKLIQLSVDLGADYGVVSILTGMLMYFPDPSVLQGKKYLILANMDPRPMAGLESRGMFLAVDDGTKPILLSVPDETPIGAHVR
jgi:methionine--tRNA ligase beta chain